MPHRRRLLRLLEVRAAMMRQRLAIADRDAGSAAGTAARLNALTDVYKSEAGRAGGWWLAARARQHEQLRVAARAAAERARSSAVTRERFATDCVRADLAKAAVERRMSDRDPD